MKISRNAKLYGERRLPEDRTTRRGPGILWQPESHPVHTMPLSPPLPLPELIADHNGNPPPDAGRIQAWPHGDEAAVKGEETINA